MEVDSDSDKTFVSYNANNMDGRAILTKNVRMGAVQIDDENAPYRSPSIVRIE